MINPFARPLSFGQKRGRAIEARLKTEELRLYAGKPGRQVRWTDRTGVISSLGAVTDPHVSQAVLSWKPITPIWREVARSRRKQEQTDKLKQSELLTPLRNKNLAAQQRLQIDARVMRITSRNPKIWSDQFGSSRPQVLIPEVTIVTANLRAFLSNECGALRLSHALLVLGVGLICWGLIDPSSANDSFSAFTRFFERMT